jgi:glycosyltransferase involved in cell wall biosynthesis
MTTKTSCEVNPTADGPAIKFGPTLRDKAPSVTVVMTQFGCEAFLAEAVGSVLAQTHRDLEIWVVDDASDHNRWIEELSPLLHDKRLRLFRSNRNVGTYRLKRLCIDHIASPYIAFHDADDASEAGRIEDQLQTMSKRRLDIVGTAYTIVDEHGVPIGSKKMPRYCNWLFKLGRVFLIHHPTTLVKREVFQEIGSFDGNTRIGADVDFSLRAAHRYRLGNSRRLQYRYRMRAASLTGAPSTGFGSDLRKAYSKIMWERENARRKGLTGDLQPLPLDEHFILTELQF